MGYLVSHLREALLLMVLDILAGEVREPSRYEPTPSTEPKEPVDGVRLSALAYLARRHYLKCFFRGFFFAPDAPPFVPPAAIGGPALLGTMSGAT